MSHSDQIPCPLCLAAKEQAYRTVYKDEFVVVVINAEPIKEGHLMVLPIRHAELMSDLTEKESAAFLKAADKCLTILSKKFDEPPLFVVHGWEHRTQPHLHAHVLPSKLALRDLLALSENTPQRIRAEKERLTKMADEIRPLIS